MSAAALQRRCVRIALGVYLCVHYAALQPYAAELFSSRGVLADASTTPFFGRVPNPLFVWGDPACAQLLVACGCILALSFACGLSVRPAALGLWAISAFLFTRNPLIANPALPFVGLLLLVYACFPEDDRDDGPWHRLTSSHGLMFVVMALGYSYSGLTKLASPSWVDGTALRHVLENPLARPGALRDVLLATPQGLLRTLSYAVLALELGFAPFCLWRRPRAVAWFAMLGMHVGILVLVDFADLTLGMLLVHAYTFDPTWLRSFGPVAKLEHVSCRSTKEPGRRLTLQ